MNQEKFLQELEYLLSDISQVGREEAMEYYRCYFEDAGAENETRVLRELGSPQKVADMIKEGLRSSGEAGEYTETGYHTEEKKEPPAGWEGPADRTMKKNNRKAERHLEKNSRKARRKVEKNNEKAEKQLQKKNRKAEKKLEKSNRKVEKKKEKKNRKAEKKQEKDYKKAEKKREQAERQTYGHTEGWREDLLYFPGLIIDIVIFCVMIAVLVAAAVLAAAIGAACVLSFISGFVILGFAVISLAGSLGLAGMALLAVSFFILAVGVLLLMALVLYCSKVLPEGMRRISRSARQAGARVNRGEE